MGEITKITKHRAIILKHLLNSVTTDFAHPLLTLINVNTKREYSTTTNGFFGSMVKHDEQEAALVSGNYSVKLGKINKQPVAEIERDDSPGASEYPDVAAKVIHAADATPIARFIMDIRQLRTLLACADGEVVFTLYKSAPEKDMYPHDAHVGALPLVNQPIEMHYTVDKTPVFSVLMPKIGFVDEEPWTPSKE